MAPTEINRDARRVASHRDEHDGCCLYADALDAELGYRTLAYLHVESVSPGFAFAARCKAFRGRGNGE